MASNMPVTPDTLITVKVAINGTNRRFKLPLRELGASVFPAKLRLHLGIPPDQSVIFERYSDSAGAYIRLDSDNPSVYKQLYRAAKAKLKLRLRASTALAFHPEPSGAGVTATLGDSLSANPVMMGGTPILSADRTKTALPTRVAVHTMLASADGVSRRPAMDSPVHPLSGDIIVPQTNSETEEKLKDMDDLQVKPSTIADQEPLPPKAEISVPSLMTYSAPYCVYCNACDNPIPDIHYHCSICDAGDFDLCPACVESGVLCGGDDHWLIKRSVQNGQVVNSTTETIGPKPRTAGQANELRAALSSYGPPADWDTRTCNSCVEVLPEANFVTCTICEDYDLCISCHVTMKHGHNPSHAFEPATAMTSLDSLAKALCAPGRNLRHLAICDGCEKNIYGVRHKCLDCPDWDYCSTCVKSARREHPGHRFAPIYEPISLCHRPRTKHFGIYCDGPLCRDKGKGTQCYITGDRYKCAVCPNVDFCAACEASPINEHNVTHPLIKLKTPVRNVAVTTLGERDNGKRMPIMGDRAVPMRSVSTETKPATKSANAAVQVQTVADLQPTVEAVEEVEEQSTATVTASSSQLNAHFVRDTVPDGSKLPQNSVFEQTWTLRNPGPVAWPAGCSVRFVGGDGMLNIDPEHPSSVTDLANATETNVIGRVVSVGETVDFSVTMRAPQREGKAMSYWRLTSADGVKFGHKLWCDIDVCQPERNVSSVEHVENVASQLHQESLNGAKPEEYLKTTLTEEGQEEAEHSAMIFPKLEKESPVSSIQLTAGNAEAVSPATEAKEDAGSIVEDLESLELEEAESEAGFLTDEEYDILDASDEEVFSEAHRAA